MWVIYILFLISYEILIDAEGVVDCDARPFENCPGPQPKFTFPGSEEEVNALCPVFIRHIDCLHNLEVECPERVPVFFGEQYDKVRGVFVEICDNKTFLHRVVTENIACIKTAVKAVDACEARGQQLRKAFHKHKESTYGTSEYEFSEEEEDDLRKYQCLVHAQYLSCAIEAVNDKCGREAKSIALEIVHRGMTLEELCKPEVMPGLSDFLDVIKVTSEEKNSIEDFVDTYKSWPGIQVMLE